MFNIDNVINSQVLKSPWLHQVIDNFFAPEDFEKVSTAAKTLQETYKEQLITADDCLSIAEVYDSIGEEVFNIILEANRKLLDNIEQLVKPYPNHYRHTEYVSFPSIHILPPNTDWQKLHDEAKDKTISIVVYLDPEISVGTTLYQSNDRNSLSKEIEWKPNTAMLFCGEDNVTWHDFCSRENTRLTLNYFIRTLESPTLTDAGDRFCWTFGNGLKTYIPKSLPSDKLELITSGFLYRTL